MNTDDGSYNAEAQRLRAVEKRKQQEQEAIQQKQEILVRSMNWRTCLNCHYFKDVRKVLLTKVTEYQHCSKFQAMPPPKVILHGCKDWINDDIPF